jgi:hypothetical protein
MLRSKYVQNLPRRLRDKVKINDVGREHCDTQDEYGHSYCSGLATLTSLASQVEVEHSMSNYSSIMLDSNRHATN